MAATNTTTNGPSANRNAQCVGPTSSNAGKASSCSGCPNQQQCASGKFAAAAPAAQKSADQISARLSSVKHIILVLSGKGGVGKSTVSSQIAWSLQFYGFEVGILDIDICGPSIARMMGVEDQQVHKSASGWTPVYRKPNLSVMSVAFLLSHKHDAIVWRGPRKNGLIKQFLVDVEWESLDFLVIDCPPGTSDEHISIAQLLSPRKRDVYTVMVSTPQEVALLDVRKEISFANKVGLNVLGVIENMSGFLCPCCNTKSAIFTPTTGGVQALCNELELDYLGSLPIDQLLLQCCENGKCFMKYAGIQSGARIAMLDVVKQVVSRVKKEYIQQIERKEMRWTVKAKKQNRNGIMDDSKDLGDESDSESDEESEVEQEQEDTLIDQSKGGPVADVAMERTKSEMDEDDIEFMQDLD